MKFWLMIFVLATTQLFADIRIENVKAGPIGPWENKVCISYEVSGTLPADANNYVLCVNASNDVSGELIFPKSVEGDKSFTLGAHKLVWNLASEGLELGGQKVNFIVGYTRPPLYRVVDLSGGPTATTKVFYIGVFEVTQRQWELVMGTCPSYYTGQSLPVESVSYDMIRGCSNGSQWPMSSDVDASSFLGVLREKTGIPFDLPTEAQWEYACRAGTTMALNSGKDLTSENMCEVGRYYGNANHTYEANPYIGMLVYSDTAIVGSYASNSWGLYDMHGNAWEWCLDWYVSELSADTDPKGGISGTLNSNRLYYRVLRGGGSNSVATSCRSAYRHYKAQPSWTSNSRQFFGFRLYCPIGL